MLSQGNSPQAGAAVPPEEIT